MLGYTPASFDIDDLSRSLHADDGIPIEVTGQILDWFATRTKGDRWSINVQQVARELGKRLLSTHGVLLHELSVL